MSISHVEKTWNEKKKLWFRQNCYPVSQNVFRMWSPNPDDWKPINHSCDPNTWLVGLNTVARRAIAKGEEITIDYSTFYNDTGEKFDCKCGAARCRKQIVGSEFMSQEVEEWYGDHVSDFVRQARTSWRQRQKSSGEA